MTRVFKLGLWVSFFLLLLGIGALMKWGAFSKAKEFCFESPVYRTNFGLYFCDSNAEADPDFYCYAKVTGLSGYWMQRPLTEDECRKNQDVPVFYPPLALGNLDNLFE